MELPAVRRIWAGLAEWREEEEEEDEEEEEGGREDLGGLRPKLDLSPGEIGREGRGTGAGSVEEGEVL